MIIAIVILAIVVIAAALGGAFWFTSRARRLAPGGETTGKTGKAGSLPFRWGYIILPIAILLLSIILTAYFYRLLPTEVAYHFKLDGSPDKWLSREMITVWLLAPQLLLTLLAGGIAWGITKLSVLFSQTETTRIKPESIVSLMGNMIALPQVILCFAMLNIFSYNSYQIYMPMWVLIVIIFGLATIVLGILLALIISKLRRQAISQPKD